MSAWTSPNHGSKAAYNRKLIPPHNDIMVTHETRPNNLPNIPRGIFDRTIADSLSHNANLRAHKPTNRPRPAPTQHSSVTYSAAAGRVSFRLFVLCTFKNVSWQIQRRVIKVGTIGQIKPKKNVCHELGLNCSHRSYGLPRA